MDCFLVTMRRIDLQLIQYPVYYFAKKSWPSNRKRRTVSIWPILSLFFFPPVFFLFPNSPLHTFALHPLRSTLIRSVMITCIHHECCYRRCEIETETTRP